MQQTLKASVYGKVQGVGYRLFCKKMAKQFGLTGYAVNLPDGRVEVLVTGQEQALSKMIEALNQGPRFSVVAGVDVEPCKAEEKPGFMIG
ncbi:acylphosphatase [Reinekea marina]|uniref:acylphosphatase n=1 Tax=Reinekea marina TaxID=1310421 RepID=A0ABV7WQA1_9GAMM|nr:acylphosphatase [Reinekea marina]MBU2863036.1 acylphosphatase [Reinekea forsetii]MDN3650281.1 acylphosphatase [Reinekea marina]